MASPSAVKEQKNKEWKRQHDNTEELTVKTNTGYDKKLQKHYRQNSSTSSKQQQQKEKKKQHQGKNSSSTTTIQKNDSPYPPGVSPKIMHRRYKAIQSSNQMKEQRRFSVSSMVDLTSLVVAIDCEMVGIGYAGLDSALAKVTIVDWNGTVLLDQHIRPNQAIIDYRTHVSGITAADLENNDNVVDAATCRAKVLQILEKKVLVGHGLRNDLSALDISHPWYMIRDTANYAPFMKTRHPGDITLWPRKLKELCSQYLNLEMQQIGKPHSSVEDANAALSLYKFVQYDWEKWMMIERPNNFSYKIIKENTKQQQTKEDVATYPHDITIPVVQQGQKIESYDTSVPICITV